jgi:hypothetical protein
MTTKRVRVLWAGTPVAHPKERPSLVVRISLDYLQSRPVADAPITEFEALGLASQLIYAVQNRRRADPAGTLIEARQPTDVDRIRRALSLLEEIRDPTLVDVVEPTVERLALVVEKIDGGEL